MKQQPLKDPYKYGFHEEEKYIFKSKKGLDAEVVASISGHKNEPEWMRERRLKSYATFVEKPMPQFGADLSTINFDDIFYYIKPTQNVVSSWDDVPAEIKNTYDKIGIPEAEKKFLAGVSAQYESEVVYKSIQSALTKKGVIFLDMDSGLREYPEIIKQYFGTIIPAGDNKFSALNTSVWSGGSFVYVPKGVRVDLPLQAYFRINAANMGQFERTLIIAEEGSFVHYVEGCFLKGARVKTAGGEKSIEQITEGDMVFTHKGRYKKVYRTMKRPYKAKIYTIQYYGDSKARLQVTAEHPLLICKRTKKEYRNTQYTSQWLHADQVEKDDYLVYPILQTSKEKKFIPTKIVTIPFGIGRHKSEKVLHLSLDPDFYRLLGYFFAEGHIDNEHYLTFTFHIKEKEYLEDVKTLLHKYFKKDSIEGKVRNHGKTITLCSTIAARYFAMEFGSTNKTKHMPLWVLESPQEHLRELMKAMWRGDGSFDKKNNMFRYSSVTKSLIDGFRDIALLLGVTSSINSQNRKYPKQIMHTVVISRTSNNLFGQIVGFSAKNGRKEGSPFFMDEQYIYLPIKSIGIREAKTMVYNFSVEDDESYVAEGVISHNCTAPIYTTDSLHSAVVEIIVKKGARVRYTTIQNWSTNVYNLVTKRARVEEEGTMEWVDGNLGSKITMKYPSVYLMGRKARGEVLSIAYAGAGQHQDAGGKAIHVAPETTSQIISKSVSKDGGRTSYRGLVEIHKGAKGAKSKVVCDALLLDPESRSDTYPTMKIHEKDVTVEHEATVSKIGDEQLFYLKSRGIAKDEAQSMIVNGFIEPIVKELPLEYAVEMNRLIQLQMEGSVG
ncbi:MAG: Fe-S cluster assembly protein SufB [Patescibacteria group bacterium]